MPSTARGSKITADGPDSGVGVAVGDTDAAWADGVSAAGAAAGVLQELKASARAPNKTKPANLIEVSPTNNPYNEANDDRGVPHAFRFAA